MLLRTILLLCQLLIIGCYGELVHLLAIWRHGDRAPSKLPYPNDKYNENYWPRGWNQLTNVGIMQTFELGQWFRRRYVEDLSFLKPNFRAKDVYIQSSDIERAIESAQAVMAGLYPASGEYKWTEYGNISAWQPVPIHTNGAHRNDTLLKPTSVACEAYSTLMKKENIINKEVYEAIYGELFHILTNRSGMNVNFYNVKRLYDITREMANSLSPPKWIEDVWKNKTILEHIIELKRITRLSEFNSYKKAKYRAGVLINDWMEKMEESVINPRKKAHLYSSHDGTLSALMYAIGVSNDQLVPYAATVICELHKDKKENYYVELKYKNGTNDVYDLQLPGCDMPCPLVTFLEQMEPTRIRNEDERKSLCSSGVNYLYITSLVIIFILINI